MPDFWSNLGSIILYTLWFFLFFAYLFAIFAVIGDLFCDRQLSGGWKAVWIICLIFLPFITLLVYLTARGRGMNERTADEAAKNKAATDEYIRSVASSPTDEITKAKSLLDAGTISAEEYEQLKTKALA